MVHRHALRKDPADAVVAPGYTHRLVSSHPEVCGPRAWRGRCGGQLCDRNLRWPTRARVVPVTARTPDPGRAGIVTRLLAAAVDLLAVLGSTVGFYAAAAAAMSCGRRCRSSGQRTSRCASASSAWCSRLLTWELGGPRPAAAGARPCSACGLSGPGANGWAGPGRCCARCCAWCSRSACFGLLSAPVAGRYRTSSSAASSSTIGIGDVLQRVGAQNLRT